MTDAELVQVAQGMLKYAYAPYSDFLVGAALLSRDGRVFTGCNVENASYGATNCAERTAVFRAVSEGYREFLAIAIVSSAGKYTYPCGICRQVLSEFSPGITVILQDDTKGILSVDLEALFPDNNIPL